jgi:hypothetical protein
MQLRTIRPDSPEQIVPYLAQVKGYPEQGPPERRLVLESQFDLSMYHAWKTVGYYALTKKLTGSQRSLGRGSVQGVSSLLGTQTRAEYLAVVLDGARADVEFDDGGLRFAGIVYSRVEDHAIEPAKRVSEVVFSYLNEQDFAVNPYEDDIRRVQNDFNSRLHAPVGNISEAVALGMQRRREWEEEIQSLTKD